MLRIKDDRDVFVDDLNEKIRYVNELMYELRIINSNENTSYFYNASEADDMIDHAIEAYDEDNGTYVHVRIFNYKTRKYDIELWHWGKVGE